MDARDRLSVSHFSPMIIRWQQLSLRPVVRSFSSSAPTCAHVSNIGKVPIRIPENVTITPTPTEVTVSGPLGTTAVPLTPFMRLVFKQPQTLSVGVEEPKLRKQRAMWGLTRTLISNAITGITEGFTVPLYLVGVGYRAAMESDPLGAGDGRSGQRLNMKLGFSHSVYVSVPSHIKAEVVTPTKIVLSCTDKHLLGLFAAKVRKWRPPEPYKGKVRLLVPGLQQLRSTVDCRVFSLGLRESGSKLSKRSNYCMHILIGCSYDMSNCFVAGSQSNLGAKLVVKNRKHAVLYV